MAKCHSCRAKDVEMLTRWERIRFWLFERVNHVFFPQDFDDLKSEQYTKGYADGNQDGAQAEQLSYARQKELYDPTPSEDELEQRMVALLSPVDPKKILSLTKAGKIYIGGEEATPGQLSNLKAEADMLKATDIWPLITESVKTLAERALFVEGDSPDFLKKGRTMLYTISTQQKIVDTLSTIKPVEKPPLT